jgi:uncharacterized LabA/DUF88 family protein
MDDGIFVLCSSADFRVSYIGSISNTVFRNIKTMSSSDLKRHFDKCVKYKSIDEAMSKAKEIETYMTPLKHGITVVEA